MASIKGTDNSSGIFSKLKIAVAFLKFVEITMASIQLTLYSEIGLQVICADEGWPPTVIFSTK
jgi:hypothetical protein